MKFSTKKLSRTFLDYEVLGAHQGIAAASIFDGPPAKEELEKGVEKLNSIFPELKGRILLELIDRLELSEGEYVSEFYSQGVSFPQTFFRLVGGQTKRHFVLLGIVHHSIADGLGGIELVKRLFLDTLIRDPEQEAVAYKEFIKQEEECFSYSGALRVAKAQFKRPSESPPLSIGRAREIAYLSLPLNEMRTIKNAASCSLNELYLHGLTAIFKYLYPDSSSRRILLPVNLRTRGLQHTLGNYLLVVPIDLPLIHSTLEEQLRTIREISGTLTDLKKLEPFRSVRTFVSSLPGFLRRRILGQVAQGSTCIATFVPQNGPERFLGDAKLIEQYGHPALLPGHELGFGLMTNGGRFSVTVIVAGKYLGRAQQLINIFENRIRALGEHYLGRQTEVKQIVR